MTPGAKRVIEKARKVEDTFGLNVTGQAYDILVRLNGDTEGMETFEDLQEAWNDYGNDVLFEEFLGLESHMEGSDAAILRETVRELIDSVIWEVHSLDELKELLKGDDNAGTD